MYPTFQTVNKYQKNINDNFYFLLAKKYFVFFGFMNFMHFEDNNISKKVSTAYKIICLTVD